MAHRNLLPRLKASGPVGLLMLAAALTHAAEPELVETGREGTFQCEGISPDGSQLCIGWEGGAGLLDLETGELKVLPSEIDNAGSFFPDGARIVAAVYGDDGVTTLAIIDVRSGTIEAIAEGGRYDWLPTFSPDGSLIAFNSYRDGQQSELYLYHLETDAIERLTHTPQTEAHARFSPDGRSLLFHRRMGTRDDGNADYDVVLMDLEARHERTVVGGPLSQSYADFSPNGDRIVFCGEPEGEEGSLSLFVMPIDGGDAMRLTEGPGRDEYATWSPCGKWIYFNSTRPAVGSSGYAVFRVPIEATP